MLCSKLIILSLKPTGNLSVTGASNSKLDHASLSSLYFAQILFNLPFPEPLLFAAKPKLTCLLQQTKLTLKYAEPAPSIFLCKCPMSSGDYVYRRAMDSVYKYKKPSGC